MLAFPAFAFPCVLAHLAPLRHDFRFHRLLGLICVNVPDRSHHAGGEWQKKARKLMETKNALGLQVHFDTDYVAVRERVTEALKAEGFGVITEIDVKATFDAKLGVHFRRYAILGACNPSLAHRALSTDLEVGLLLPCNVLVYEDEGGSGATVSIIDPLVMFGMGMNPALQPVADEVGARLHRVAAALAQAA